MTRPTDLTIPATDGVGLAATLHTPSAPPSEGALAVIIAPALGTWRRYYEGFAGDLARRGHAAVAFDYRGSGESPLGARSPREARMRHWGERDLAGVIGWAGKRWPERPIALVGHSAGAQMLALAENAEGVSALLSVASGSGYWGHREGISRWLLAASWHVVIPLAARLLGKFPGRRLGLLGDLPAGIALEWASWCRDPRYFLGEAGPSSVRNRERFRGRLRAYAFTDDRYLPPAAVRPLPGWYPSARAGYVEVDPEDVGATRIGHFGFFRERFRKSLWAEAAAWLEGAGPGGEGSAPGGEGAGPEGEGSAPGGGGSPGAPSR